jgi:hypothetical protein
MKKSLSVLLSLGLLSLNSGCEECRYHHYHEPGAPHYSMGKFYSVEKIPFEQAWSGALKAMGELGFVVTMQEKNALFATLIARGTNDKRIEVKLEKQSEGLTKILILVDKYGDESLSNRILEEIKKQT